MTGALTPRTVGFEFEVARNGLAVLAELDSRGVVPEPRLHYYHCACDDCDHQNYGPDDSWLFSPQEDCTVSAEFVSKVLEWNSPRMDRAMQVMQICAARAGAQLSGHSGMHCHVNKPVDRREDGKRSTVQATTFRLLRMFVRYNDDLAEYAAAGRESVRDYNRPVAVRASRFWTTDIDADYDADSDYGSGDGTGMAGGSWFHPRAYTYEFRLWNATKLAWRMRLAVGLSVAMVNAAEAGVDVSEHDERPFEEVLAPWLDDEMWSAILRHRYSKGGIN